MAPILYLLVSETEDGFVVVYKRSVETVNDSNDKGNPDGKPPGESLGKPPGESLRSIAGISPLSDVEEEDGSHVFTSLRHLQKVALVDLQKPLYLPVCVAVIS